MRAPTIFTGAKYLILLHDLLELLGEVRLFLDVFLVIGCRWLACGSLEVLGDHVAEARGQIPKELTGFLASCLLILEVFSVGLRGRLGHFIDKIWPNGVKIDARFFH